jgi:hypothetical protein
MIYDVWYMYIYIFFYLSFYLCIYMIYIYIVHIYKSIYIYLFIYLYYDNINICSYFQVLESTATCRFCGFSPKAACKTCCAGTTAATAARSRGFQNAACYSPSKCQGILSSFESRHDTPEENFVFFVFCSILGGQRRPESHWPEFPAVCFSKHVERSTLSLLWESELKWLQKAVWKRWLIYLN